MSIYSLTYINMNRALWVTPHLGFGLDGVHIEDDLFYLNCNGTREKRRRRGRIRGGEKRRWRGGEDLGRDATFLWSRALTYPPRCI